MVNVSASTAHAGFASQGARDVMRDLERAGPIAMRDRKKAVTTAPQMELQSPKEAFRAGEFHPSTLDIDLENTRRDVISAISGLSMRDVHDDVWKAYKFFFTTCLNAMCDRSRKTARDIVRDILQLPITPKSTPTGSEASPALSAAPGYA